MRLSERSPIRPTTMKPVIYEAGRQVSCLQAFIIMIANSPNDDCQSDDSACICWAPCSVAPHQFATHHDPKDHIRRPEHERDGGQAERASQGSKL